jgi:hypothetical protein
MKKLFWVVLVSMALFSNEDLSKYSHINIQKNISQSAVEFTIEQSEKFKFKTIANPKFNCKDLGFNRVIMQGRTSTYEYIHYKGTSGVCIETTYLKNDKIYGDKSIAVLNK